MIYFDNAATGGRKPDEVISAVSSALRVCANPGRSGHKLSLSCANLVQVARSVLSDYFNGYGFERVVFTKNCTEALNIAIFGVLRPGDHVVATCMEHNSVLRPLETLRKAGIITYDICPLSNHPKYENNIAPSDVAALVKPNTKMVIVTTASNVTGAIPPLQEIYEALPKDVLLLCDGAQGAGHLDLDMQRMKIDLLSVAGHKGMQGIQGSGALLFSERVNPTPILYGGTGSISLSLDMPDFYPDGLEAGTLSYPAIISLLEGTRHLTAYAKRIRTRIYMLTERLCAGLRKLQNYKLYSIPNPCGIVAFSHNKYPSDQMADILSNDYNIALRGGLHCAPLMHESLSTLDNGLLRASFSHFNSETEVNELLSALAEIDKM